MRWATELAGPDFSAKKNLVSPKDQRAFFLECVFIMWFTLAAYVNICIGILALWQLSTENATKKKQTRCDILTNDVAWKCERSYLFLPLVSPNFFCAFLALMCAVHLGVLRRPKVVDALGLCICGKTYTDRDSRFDQRLVFLNYFYKYMIDEMHILRASSRIPYEAIINYGRARQCASEIL